MMMFGVPSDSQQSIADLARREAERSSPRFSDALHARIMTAVESREISDIAEADAIVPRPRTGPAPILVMAVVCLSAAALVLVKVGPASLTDPRSIASVNPGQSENMIAPVKLLDVSSVNAVPRQVGAAVETAMAQEQWAGLDQDARRVTRYLVDQVPFQAAWKR